MMATPISQLLKASKAVTKAAFERSGSVSDKAVEYDGYLSPHKDVIQSRYILSEINMCLITTNVDMINWNGSSGT